MWKIKLNSISKNPFEIFEPSIKSYGQNSERGWRDIFFYIFKHFLLNFVHNFLFEGSKSQASIWK